MASIELNGHALGSTANQFRRYVFDVKSVVKHTGNMLVVRLQGPVAYAAATAADYPYPLQAGQFASGLPNANFIRKVQLEVQYE